MKVIGNQIGSLVRQTGDSATQLEDGTWEATVVYVCRWQSVIYLAPRRNQAYHPDFSSLICSRCSVERLKPGTFAKLNVIYRGFFGPEPDPTEPPADTSSEEIITSTSEAPIETHPDFTGVLGGTKDAPLNGAVFNDDGTFKGWRSDSRYAGKEAFLIPSTVYRRSTPSRGRPANLGPVGKIQNAPVGVSGDNNWLFTCRSWRRDGAVYEVSEEYMLSGPGGWDDTIYGS